MIHTLLADDSASFRAAVGAVLAEAGGFRIVGGAADGDEAVRMACTLRPNLIVMDVLMPGLDGIDATARIMEEAPCAVVVMSALMDADSQQVVFRALQAGAVEALGKPKDLTLPRSRAQLVEALRAMAAVKVVRRRGSARPAPVPVRSSPVKWVALGASTGGPPALCEVLRHLPRDFPAPILIAQHLAVGFVGGLARWLQEATGLRVTLVQDSASPASGVVYLPTDGHHLEVREGRIWAVPGVGEAAVPSVDRLFDSLVPEAEGVLAVLLTGMGSDGARALCRVRAAGGYTMTQDEASSLVYGMPRVARELGGACEELGLASLGPRLRELALGGST